ITQNNKQRKRGIRVYPRWDKATSKQAQKTKGWQTKYFFTISKDETADLNSIKTMFGSNSKTD
ncbi:MAG: MepB family protein, partial [Verrucomicrobia bacterium]|nr:MepB family protein [Cytophagales bacterium]